MTPHELRGKRVFLFLTALIILAKLNAAWHGNFLIPLALVFSIPFLWLGSAWMRWLVGGTCILAAGIAGYRFLWELHTLDLRDGASTVFVVVLGVVDGLTALAILGLPSLQAFFRYQREGPLTEMVPRNGLPPPVPTGVRSFSQVMTAAGWGLCLGCATGFMAAGQYVASSGFEIDWAVVLATMLGGTIAGGFVGAVVGFVVGVAQPKSRQSGVRLLVTRGLIGAGFCVSAGVMLAALWGGLTGGDLAPIYGPPGPGLAAAVTVAGIAVIFAGPAAGVVGFVLGSTIALLNDGESTTARFSGMISTS